jgi:inhibitor of cysteine peptidase
MRAFLLFLFVFTSVGQSFAAVENTELLDSGSTVSAPKYEYKLFTTCQQFQDTMKKILPKTSGGYGIYARDGGMMVDTAESSVVPMPQAGADMDSSVGSSAKSSSSVPYSETNTQVLGIDEADTVKTDGKYIYFYQETGEKAIVVLDAKTLVRIKAIRIPTNYSNVSFYLTKTNLVITATKYTNYNARWYGWYQNNQTSIIALYDIRNPAKASLVRTLQVEGSLSDSRLTDNGVMTAVVSTSYGFPPIYYAADAKMAGGSSVAYEYSPKTLIPRITDTKKGKTESKSIVDCQNLGFVLPDLSTLENYSISPTLTSIISFDTTAVNSTVNSNVILGDAGQIHVSRSSVYLTSHMWSPNTGTSSAWACPPNARCAMPAIWNPGTSSTLVHRFALDGQKSKYAYTTLVEGSPLTQYSMDEDANGYFRIVTSKSEEKRSTQVTVLSNTGKIVGSLKDIAPGETFQGSRFIGDRLYLVTFEQIDPLFVISLSNPKKPTILGELKIPGYSTYLHPYDSDRLIGLGYDTKTNSWGGTQNAGIKVDLYNVRDVKNPKQEQSFVVGSVGSSTDALWNPRVFTYYKELGVLLLPGTYTKSANDPNDLYRSSDIYQGVVGVSIQPTGITEKFRVTHLVKPSNLDELWKKDCAQYKSSGAPKCYTLIDGGQYCEGSTNYVPPYCYAGSTSDAYFVNQIWNYSNDFISRAIYIGGEFYTLSPSRISRWSFADTRAPVMTSVIGKTTTNVNPVSISLGEKARSVLTSLFK